MYNNQEEHMHATTTYIKAGKPSYSPSFSLLLLCPVPALSLSRADFGLDLSVYFVHVV